MKTLILSLGLYAATHTAMAAEQVVIYSRFVANQEFGIMNQFIADELNKIQTDYEFRTAVIAGSQGIAAELRALAAVKEGKKVLVAGTISNFTFNRYFNPETPNQPNVFEPVINLVSLPAGILVSPSSNINSVDELVSYLKSKPVAYRATSLGAISHTFLDLVFRKYKGITNVKDLQYPIKEIPRNILTGEADYTMSSIEGNDQLLKPILITSGAKNKKYANIPTADSVGMPDLLPVTASLLYVPVDQPKLSIDLKDMLLKICQNSKFSELANRFDLDKDCVVDNKQLSETMFKHQNFILKYKD